MKDGLLKTALRNVFFPPGSVRKIRFGPLRKMSYRIGPITGLSPWYSGGERDQQRFFQSALRIGNVAIDVGANWGLHTLCFSQLVGSTGRVIALEPFPPAFRELEWHVAENGCSNVSAHAVAISDKEGEGIFIPGDTPTTGMLEFNASGPSPANGISVRTCILDTLVSEERLERIDLIKVDVEGAESRVLAGCENVVERFRPTMLIELHTPDQDILVARWLTERGYRLERLTGPPILSVDRGWPDQHGVWGTIIARLPS